MVQLRDYIEVMSSDGKTHIIAEIDVDTASELPAQEYGPYFLNMGSIARDISTGDFYSMDSTGTWYNQDGSGAYTPASASTLSMPKLSKLNEESIEEAEVNEDAEVVRDAESE